MDKLGTEYDSIFDYSREHPEETLRVRCLVMYDFPRNISDSILTDVRNILRNGSRCGIYTMIIARRRSQAHVRKATGRCCRRYSL